MSTLTIAAVQYDIQWLDQPANFNDLAQLIENHFTDHAAADLLLLPETFSTGFCINKSNVQEPEDGGLALAWLKKIARQYNCVVAGSVLVSHNDKKVNRFYWVFADGTVQYYDKRHLFRLGKEQDHVEPGNNRKVITINGIKILPLVCYDLRFPVWCRNRQDYDLMINVANWPAARRHVWDTLLKARAMENQCFVVGVNRIGADGSNTPHSGGTTIIDFTGETIVYAADNLQQIITTQLDFSTLEQFKDDFPAFLDADEFELL
ncbi:carbon-nitrogen hydrolase [Colwellia sp. MT41]|uniref:Nitrilase family protein n=1 Tax=Colwellia marinimaniae TaxID=1513592 RepID=A0ABQ0MUP2_9GAMM|nr:MULTISPECIES: amidohydrolase [Colwellia]ALO34182.1 carbon-nitrogen hydrolase [Colwellia sp. MT41]GAW96091.1 nitrilase family protein [Colwellia marinimaniae]